MDYTESYKIDSVQFVLIILLTFNWLMLTYYLWQMENDYCLLLALPCGRDQEDVLGQTQALKSGFITYLQAKQAAGIINVPNPGSNQVCSHFSFFLSLLFMVSHISSCCVHLSNYRQLTWCKYSHLVNSRRAIFRAWLLTFSTASPAFPLTS